MRLYSVYQTLNIIFSVLLLLLLLLLSLRICRSFSCVPRRVLDFACRKGFPQECFASNAGPGSSKECVGGYYHLRGHAHDNDAKACLVTEERNKWLTTNRHLVSTHRSSPIDIRWDTHVLIWFLFLIGFQLFDCHVCLVRINEETS